ncbi:TetR/AcrR family transcriptional regulator [Pseudovibrio brasiliensis]|uniref:TetR/AcrR family transcriptional regulator n=1 Tax=Pseudovibrio brasiliensis TaxID=1898042 RepID=A0ABX8AV52_9HYPH|nr:TetR/AcrR family transcriptional regulator [Pseudovibrio brasiliensis]QUS57556.1 TetR/AcrR family transcriptional regulator [Pseudovibrio brasiliensis]
MDVEHRFDTCVQVLLMKGLESSTMADLAQACGIPEKEFVQEYTSKQGVIQAANTWYFRKYTRHLNTEIAMHADLYSAVEALLLSVIDIAFDLKASDKRHSVRTLMELALLDDQFRDNMDEMFAAWYGQLREKVSQFSLELKDPSEIEALTFYVKERPWSKWSTWR